MKKLNKFIRKNSRIILPVAMAFLLITFLIPTSVQSCNKQGDLRELKLGHADALGKDITTTDAAHAENERKLVSYFRMGVVDQLDAIDYMLLVNEAKRAGIHVGEPQVQEFLRSRGVTGEMLAERQSDTGRSYPEIYRSLGDWLAVMQLADLVNNSAGDSLPRMQSSFRDQRQNADVRVSLLHAAAFTDRVGEPTADDLKALFDQGRDKTAGKTDDKPDFGYKVPDRVQIEFLSIDPTAVETTTRVKDAEVSAYFQQHPEKYTKTAPSPDTQTSQPAAPTKIPMTFEEAEPLARNDARREKAVHEAQKLLNEIRAEAERPWIGAARDADSIRAQPAGEPVSFETLRNKYAAQTKIEYRRTDLVDAAALRSEFGANMPMDLDARRPISLADMAFRVKGLATASDADVSPILNLNEPSPVLMTRTFGSRQPQSYKPYFFRVLKVEAAHPAESIESIHDQLAKDWKDQKAFEMAGTYAEKLATRAREIGLQAAVEESQELKDILSKAEAPTSQPTEGETPPATKNFTNDLKPVAATTFLRSRAILGTTMSQTLAQKVWEVIDASPTAESQGAHRIVVVPLATQKNWALVELLGLKPIYEGDFAKVRPQLIQQAEFRDQRQVFAGWLASDNIRKRAGYKSLKPVD